MKYHLKNENYYTFETFAKNKLPPRSYFIPFSEKEKALAAEITTARYTSDLVVCLSGEWDFCFFKDPKDLLQEFDTDKTAFDKVTVPSVWEYSGYLDPMYLTTYIPFRFNPPKIPKEREIGLFRLAWNNLQTHYARGQYNSVGVYRKKFFVTDLTKNYTISFLGVAACLDLFLNGKFVGYSEGSHNTAEFLLDEFLTEGENELVAVVHRFCNGTYLETQDMFRNSGIFRDVLLRVSDRKHLWDYEIKTPYRGDGKYDLYVTVFVDGGEAGDEVAADFFGETKKGTCDESGKVEILFSDLKVKEWSAETPNLYTVTISFADKEYVCEEVGFRRIEIQKDVFLFNGKKIKVMGVNHHDTHPEKGSAMSVSDMEKDVKLMKEYNVNAVRTSHYPPDPVFVRLCKKYGLYTIEEADIETHCAHAIKNMTYISRDEKWKEHYLDRVKRMYGRDKNLCNVILWSLCNESGGMTCQKYCYDYLKTVTDTPVHYEWQAFEEKAVSDVLSEMYTPIEKMKERAASRQANARRMKPYLLCEYAHAMGVGPGALEDYVELFLSEDVYMGGCIWEWADHAVYHKENGNYTYGGDHHDYINDKTFCVDGIFRPDREPYTSAYVMKTAYRPIRAKHLGDGKVMFTNVNRFLSSEHLTVKTRLCMDGKEQEEKTLSFVLGPQESTTVEFTCPEGKDAFLNVTYVEKGTGRTVAEEQVALSEALPKFVLTPGAYNVVKKNGKLSVTSGDVRVTFDLKKGGLSSYRIGEKELIGRTRNRQKTSIYNELYRASMSNDIKIEKEWVRKGLSCFTPTRPKTTVYGKDGFLCVKQKYRLVAFLLPIAKVEDVYLFGKEGVSVKTTIGINVKTMLPRIGKTLELNKEFDNVRYYGRGDKESYPDMKAHTKIGLYEKKGDFGEKMIVPQCSGERCDVRWAEITDKAGTGLRITAVEKPFGLNVNHYNEKDISKWKHIIDYRDLDATYVNIDGYLCGVGSNSCGPLPEEKYRIPRQEKYEYSFILSPITFKQSRGEEQ
ncbi:MAG: hypothetical protein J5781_07680 [Clostridia bacterium]|nr:hypothetical protein [Clostridia bacterium]